MSIGLCKFKNMFGLPNQGVHKYRFFGLAIVDVILTILVAILLSYIISLSWLITIPFMFLFGIICHKIFCVDTTINGLINKYL